MEFNKYKDFGDYHWVEYNNRTVYYEHVEKVKKWIREGSTLDIGAGDGLITYHLNADGLENDPYALDICKKKNLYFVKYGDAYALPKDKKYDNVFMGDVIEHLEYPEKVIEQIYDILNENGHLYIVTPPARRDGILQDKYHYREYTPDQLIDSVEKFNFKLASNVEIIQRFVRMYAEFKKI